MSDAFLSRLQSGLGGTYVLERELAGGGMSRVFAGTETTYGRVVVKVLPAERATGDPIERFKREAELGARLEHPHIVPVYDVGEVDDIRYFTMPFIDGETLRQRLNRNGALSADEVHQVLREIGSALAYAHGRGVVHRDVKPEKIFIEHTTGRALLADFGVAMAVGARSDVTQPGSIVGTPAYMSPEQAEGADIDGRSDVYSLGLVGWEILTGRLPWSDPYDSVRDMMHRQRHDLLPSLADLGIAAPRDLVETIERALQKDRRLRWATAAAFVGGLGAAVRDPESAVTTQRLEARGQRPVLQRSEAQGQGPELQRAQDQGSGVRNQESELVQPEERQPQQRERAPESPDEWLKKYRRKTPEDSEAPAVRSGEWRADPARWDEELAAVWGGGRGARRGRGGRYAVAALILVCGVAIVGAATVGPATLMRQFTSGGGETEPVDAVDAVDARTGDIDTRIDKVAAGDMAAGLIGIEGARASAPRATMSMKARRSALPPAGVGVGVGVGVAAIGAPEHVERVAANRPRSDVRRQPASSGNSVRGRIATAILSLQEYEKVQAAMSAARAGMSRAPAAPLPAPPPPPPSGSATPSVAP